MARIYTFMCPVHMAFHYKRIYMKYNNIFYWNSVYLQFYSIQTKVQRACNYSQLQFLHCPTSNQIRNIIVKEWKTNLMSPAILFHFLCAQHVSDINISIIRSLRLCWWITTSVVFFSARCVLELWLPLVFGGVRFAGWSISASTCNTNTTKYQPQQKLQHTTNWEQDDRCGNSSTQSQAPEDGYINVRNMVSA